MNRSIRRVGWMMVLPAFLGWALLSIGSQGEARGAEETVEIDGEKPGEKITVNFGKFARYFEITNVKFVKDFEVNEIGKVIDFRRVTFIAKARHDIAVVPFASVKFLDSEGVLLPGPNGQVSRKGYVVFGGFRLDEGSKIPCHVDLYKRNPRYLDLIVR